MNYDDDGQPVRRPARFQISENTLFNAGMDRPTVEALRHLLNKVGNSSDTASLPDTVADLGSVSLEVAGLSVAPVAVALPFPDDVTPVQQIMQMVEFIQTEVRHNAEEIARLNSLINDLKQGIYP